MLDWCGRHKELFKKTSSTLLKTRAIQLAARGPNLTRENLTNRALVFHSYLTRMYWPRSSEKMLKTFIRNFGYSNVFGIKY